MPALRDDASVVQRILDHIDRSTTDLAEGVWREPAWLVQGIDRDEAIHFGRTFRQNTIVLCRSARPELIVTDPTCDDVGRSFVGNWRIRQ